MNAINIAEELGCTRALIVSDSLSALRAISSLDSRGDKHRAIYKIMGRLQELAKLGISISFLWVPSHINLYGNDIADYLSRRAAEEALPLEGRLRDVPCFINDALNELTKEYESFSFNEIIEEAQFKGFRYFNKIKEKNRGDWFRKHSQTCDHPGEESSIFPHTLQCASQRQGHNENTRM